MPAQEKPLVEAPPSLRPALNDILPMSERESGATVQIVYTASRTLVLEIKSEEPIDASLPAGGEDVEHLHKQGLTLDGRPRIYAQMSFVLVMSADSSASLISFHEAVQNQTTIIALGETHTSSLGAVTAQALAKLHSTRKSRSNLLYAPHSEGIFQLIRTGKAHAGLVYRADAINSGQVRTSDETPFGRSGRVQFGQAMVSTCRATLCPIAE